MMEVAMTITLSPELEARLKEAASRLRVSPDEYAASLIDSGLSTPHRATIDLLRSWQAAERTRSAAEQTEQQNEAEAFMQSLARSRSEMEGQDARKLWP
jgi:predicted transcriptional regulator